MQDPPNEPWGFYLTGDYSQMRATGSASNTKVYVLWTGYDEDAVGRRDSVFCTTLTNVFTGLNRVTVPWKTFP